MARSTTRVSVEAAVVALLAVGAWRVLRQPEPAPVPSDPAPSAAEEGERERRVASVLAQRKAERAARAESKSEPTAAAVAREEPDPRQAFRVEATAPPPPAPRPISGRLLDEHGQPLRLPAQLVSEAGGFTLGITNGVFQGVLPVGHWESYLQVRTGAALQRVGPITLPVGEGENSPLVIEVPGVQSPVGPGFAFAHRGEFLEVQEVEAGSPAAAAGLAPGDAIVEVNHHPVREWDAATVARALLGAPDTPYQIKVVAPSGEGFTETTVELRRPGVAAEADPGRR
jgi:hypothetical protein